VLAEQVEQRGLQRGDGVNGDAQVEGLQAAAAGVTVGEGAAHLAEQRVVLADRFADQQGAGIVEGLADGFAARHFADADVAGAVLEDEDVAGEPGPMGAAEVHQHAVLPGDGHDGEFGDAGRARHGGGHGCPSVVLVGMRRPPGAP